MNNQKKDENIMNELFEDFQHDSQTDTNNTSKKIFVVVVLLIVLIVVVGLALMNLKKSGNENVFIEGKNYSSENEVKKVKKDFVYGHFLKDDSWGGILTKDRFENYWGEENITINDDKSLTVQYPQGSYKPSASPRGGAGFIYNIGEGKEVLSLNYDVTFADNFEFIKGGKLPGLCGGDCPRGDMDNTNGFSVRFAWRADGYLDTYSSFPGAKKYGEFENEKAFQFEAGKTYNIQQKIKLNTPGESNGILQVFINGESISLNNEMMYRNTDEVQINSLFFNTFFGGSDDSWATPNDTFITFNNFTIE